MKRRAWGRARRSAAARSQAGSPEQLDRLRLLLEEEKGRRAALEEELAALRTEAAALPAPVESQPGSDARLDQLCARLEAALGRIEPILEEGEPVPAPAVPEESEAPAHPPVSEGSGLPRQTVRPDSAPPQGGSANLSRLMELVRGKKSGH